MCPAASVRLLLVGHAASLEASDARKEWCDEVQTHAFSKLNVHWMKHVLDAATGKSAVEAGR